MDTDMKPLSREFLLSRGYCCHNNCRNCPYEKDVGEKLPVENRASLLGVGERMPEKVSLEPPPRKAEHTKRGKV